MKVDIIDSTVLRSITPKQIKLYLQKTGWEHEKDERTNNSVWKQKKFDGSEEFLRIPISLETKYYENTIKEALEKLSLLENRSQLHVLREVKYINSDIFIFIFEDKQKPLGKTVEILQLIRQIFLLSASFVLQRNEGTQENAKEAQKFADQLLQEQGDYDNHLAFILISEIAEIQESDNVLPVNGSESIKRKYSEQMKIWLEKFKKENGSGNSEEDILHQKFLDAFSQLCQINSAKPPEVLVRLSPLIKD